MGEKNKKILLMVIFMPLAVVAYVFVTMYLWNWLVPEIFDGPELSIYQTIGLLLLAKLIFWTRSSRSHKCERCDGDKGSTHRYFDKWGCKSYSEKEKLKSRIQDIQNSPEEKKEE